MRRLGTLIAGAALAAGLVVAGPTLAGAVPGYPPPPPHSGQGSVTGAVGSTVSFTVCGYRPGATVVIDAGPGSGFVTANPGGCVTVSVKISSGPEISIDGGRTFARPCGAAPITLFGPTPSGTSLNWTETINITGCSSDRGGVGNPRPVPTTVHHRH